MMARVSKKAQACAVWLLWLLIVVAVSYEWANGARVFAVQRAPQPTLSLQAPYPPGRWRLATQGQLEPSLLWVSHILIRYEGASSSVPFATPVWHNGLPVSPLSRAAALERARALAHELRGHPDQFQDYARRYSEDPPTSEHGGSLGGVSGYQLSFWPAVMDALAVLAPGEVSEPVETEYGFHILLRRAAPEPDTVTGAHIVIGHDGAQWLHSMQARGSVPARTREEARALAQSLYERARQDPAQFPALIQQYSEHRDASWLGDIGTWSTREPTPFPRQVETLQSVPVGGVAAPLETLLGFEVLMRVPHRERREYAMMAIGLSFDPFVQPSDPLSQASALELARQIRRELERDPAQFERYLESHCCPGKTRWREGEFPELDDVFAHLAIGQIPPEPIASVRQYLIPRRLELSEVPRPPTRLELPSPEHPDLPYLVGRIDAARARTALLEFARTSLGKLELGASNTALLLELHEHPWTPALDTALVEKRSDAFSAFLQQLEHTLPSRSYQQYLTLLEDDLARRILYQDAL